MSSQFLNPATPHPAAQSAGAFAANPAVKNLSPNIVAALASNGTNTPATAGAIDTIKQSLATAWQNVGHIFSDPGLQKQPTTAQQIGWHIYNTGIPAIAHPDIVSTQQHLIDSGYAKGLQADGVWNSNWQQATHTMNLAQQQKPAAGNFSPMHLFHSVFDTGLLSKTIPFLTNLIVPILHSTDRLLANTAQAATDIVTGQALWGNKNEPSLGDHVAAAIESIDRLLSHKSPESAQQYLQSYAGKKDLIDGIGTALMISSIATGSGELAAGVRGSLAAAGEKGATSLGQKLVTDLGAQATRPRLTVLNTLLPKVAAEDGTAAGRRFAFTKSLEGSSTSRYIYRPLSTIATKTGDAWQAVRTVAATPYRLPIVGIAGQLGQSAMVLGMKGGLIGALEEGAGDPNATVATTLEHTAPIAGVLGTVLNGLSVGLHSPAGVPTASQNIGAQVEKNRMNVEQALNQTDIIPQWERATGTSFTKVSNQLAKAGYTSDEARMSIITQYEKLAAQHTALGRFETSKLAQGQFTDDAKFNYIQAVAHEILNRPDKLQEAVTNYALHPNQFQADLAHEVAIMKQNPKFDKQNDWAHFLTVTADARKNVMPDAHHFITPDTMSVSDGWTTPEQATMVIPGKIGLMRNDNLDASQFQAKAREFYTELEKAKPGFTAPDVLPFNKPDWNGIVDRQSSANLPKSFDATTATMDELKLRSDVLHLLGQEAGVNINTLHFVPTEDLIKLVVQESQKRPLAIHPNMDAPQAFHDAVARTNEDGYKYVYGTDIGHQLLPMRADLAKLGAGRSRVARFADKAGLNFSQVSNDVAGSQMHSALISKLQDVINDPKKISAGDLPSWVTADRLLSYAYATIEPKIGSYLGAQFSAAAKLGKWDKEIEDMMKARDVSRGVAQQLVKESLMSNTGPQVWSKKDFLNAVMAKGMVPTVKGSEIMGIGADEKTALRLWDGMKAGLNATPAYVEGFNPFNKMLDSFFAIGGKTVPITGWRIGNPTAGLRQYINAMRYQGSPRFAYLRIFKTALKASTEGVPFALDAAKAQEIAGTTQADNKILDMYFPKTTDEMKFQDEVSKFFTNNDIYNVYQPHAIDSRIIGYLHRTAMDNPANVIDGKLTDAARSAVIKKFTNITSYGNRTAAEKSVNAIFFPFSFEKTVMRQIGGHLLDHAGERLIISSAMNLYDNHPGVRQWAENNMPLFKELEKFNPFYHGVGLGQFGGINRMYFDAVRTAFIQGMSPQGITSVAGLKALTAYTPALRDLNAIILGMDPNGVKPTQTGGEVGTTLKTTAWELGQLMKSITGHKDSTYTPKPLLSYDVQQNEGWNMRTKLLTQFSQYLLDNQQKAKWGFDADVPVVGGQPITKANINYLVHHVYPAWDANKGLILTAEAKQAAVDEAGYLQSRHPSILQDYRDFVKAADTISGRVSKNKYVDNTPALAADTMAMRQAAIALAESDKSFYAFYKKYYQNKFGPLEMMQ